MVKIRLMLRGRHRDPMYRIVVTDSRRANCGKYLEKVGFFKPKNDEIFVNQEKLDKWLKYGAKMSDTVRSLVKEFNKVNVKTKTNIENRK
ncbi:MAG: 30S ribosomal protein S16 [Bacilli bacterium]|nr:30S ribosomal protein S16 [Bacilli bacterium]